MKQPRSAVTKKRHTLGKIRRYQRYLRTQRSRKGIDQPQRKREIRIYQVFPLILKFNTAPPCPAPFPLVASCVNTQIRQNPSSSIERPRSLFGSLIQQVRHGPFGRNEITSQPNSLLLPSLFLRVVDESVGKLLLLLLRRRGA